jgi:glyoxylase-like metal-dependent hydrolase (beta-lactamase superfamily II)
MAIQAMKDLYIIKVPLPGSPLKDLNCYLIKGQESSLLIDTGFNHDVCYRALVNELKDLDVNPDQMDIFLTHFHADHTGLCGRLKVRNNRIFMPERDLQQHRQGFSMYEMVVQALADGFSKEEIEYHLEHNPLKDYLPGSDVAFTGVKDGFQLPAADYCFTAVSVPGHTPGHMCLYEASAGILMMGDHILFGITPNITRWKGVEDSLGDYLQSLEKVAALPVKAAFCAHREPAGNAQGRAKELKMHHLRRLEEVWSILAANPGFTAYEVAGRMRWSIKAADWASFPTMQKYFAVGEANAHLDHLICKNRVEARRINGILHYKTKGCLNREGLKS